MAELYLGDDTTTGTRVVIKRILPYLSEEADFVQMFLDEARIASQLNHDNIVQLYELGQKDGSIFIAMEYVEGADLRQLFQEEQRVGEVVPYDVAAWVVSEVCKGLHHAHLSVGLDGKPLGIIHRDVSPQNVVVGRGGQVKLVDFGIAKATAMMERSKPGIIKGKFLYLSPEQIAQEEIDLRSDLFALGSMLYEITTGTAPFARATSEAVLYAIRLEEPKRPDRLREGYPPMLADIVMKCLRKDRQERYASAQEVHEDLQRFLLTLTAQVNPGRVGQYVADLLLRRHHFRELNGTTSFGSYPTRLPEGVEAKGGSQGSGGTPKPGSAHPTAHIRPPPSSPKEEHPTSHVVVPRFEDDESLAVSSFAASGLAKRWAWFFVGLCLMGSLATAFWPLEKRSLSLQVEILPENQEQTPVTTSKVEEASSTVSILFQAPRGTRIQDLETREWFAPSVRYVVKKGTFKLSVRCPGKKKSFEHVVELSPKLSTPQNVRLCEST